MTRTIPFQVASGSNVNVPVTSRSPYPVLCQPLKVKSPLITVVIGLVGDIAEGILDCVALPLTTTSAVSVIICTRVFIPSAVCSFGDKVSYCTSQVGATP